MTIPYIFLTVLIFLSFLDLKNRRIPNIYPIVLIGLGLIYSLYRHQFLITCLGMGLFSILSIFLWKKGIFGGGDSKIMICLMPFLIFNGFPNMIVTMWLFLIEFLIVGIIYSVIIKFLFRQEKFAFVPAIAISYLISIIYRIN